MTDVIQLLKPSDGTPGSIVACWPTSSKHFVITAEVAISFKPVWNLTHKVTTAKVLGPFETQEEVRLMAAIMAALPFPWSAITVDHILGSEKMKKQFRTMWEAMPQKILEWRTVVSEACNLLFGDLMDEQERLNPPLEDEPVL